MENKQFKAESKRLLDLMINSIYTNKEIFLRELISNASDAIDKLYYRSLTDKNVKVNKDDLYIRITPNKEARTLTIEDNGCGMNKEELEENLGTIAKSGSLAFKDAMKKADPVLLEPIMKVEVTMPEEYMGDVIGDINSRRGRIEGMDDLGGGKIVHGYVPLAEMFGYSTDLRSRTQGRGNYSMFFEKYEPVPKSVQEKILSSKND